MSSRWFQGHPRGILVLLAIEVWERFSYYGMRALLIFYLTQHFLFTDEQSFLIYGAYSGLVYMMPVIGGYIADRYLGARKSIVFGAVLLSVGHLMMAIEGPSNSSGGLAPNSAYVQLFYLALAFIIMGVGFIKTSTTTAVGSLYDAEDPRRDAGFTWFYLSGNVGGFVAPLLCGWIGQAYGWRYGFGLAGLGMLIGMACFLAGQKHLPPANEPSNPDWLNARLFIGLSREAWVYIGTVLGVVLVWLAVQNHLIVGSLLAVASLLSVGGILYFAMSKGTATEKRRVTVCLILIAFTVGFWAFYEQMGSSLNLFADRMVDRSLFGLDVHASTLQSLPALLVVLLAPVFGSVWLGLGRRNREPSSALKFGIGLLFLVLAFMVLALGTRSVGGDGRVDLIWYVLCFAFLVCGELCIGPVGFSMVTRLAPKPIVGVMTGSFFLAYAGSSFIAGLLARLTVPDSRSASIEVSLTMYSDVFLRFGGAALVVAVVLIALSPILSDRR